MWFDNFLHWLTQSGTAGGAIVAAAVAIVIFLLTRVVEIFYRWRDARGARRRAVVGLYTEVRYNLNGISSFLDAPSSYPAALQDKVRGEPNFRPLMIVDETSQFYDSIISSLPDIHPECIKRLTEFYSVVRKLHDIRDAFEGSAYPTISPDGRAGTIDELWQACRRAEIAGWRALYELELAYPRHWFTSLQ
jgi:hypothetical protein